MPPYYTTSPSPHPTLPLQPGSTPFDAHSPNPRSLQRDEGCHSPYNPALLLPAPRATHSPYYPTSIPAPRDTHPPHTYNGNVSFPQQWMLDFDPHPVHQGGMSTYDKSRLADWVAANSVADHAGHTDGPWPHSHRSSPAVSSKATTHDHHPRPRQVPTATTPHHRPTALEMPEPRFSRKKEVRFTPSVQARDDEKHEVEDRTISNGTRMSCEHCHVKRVDWTVDDQAYCDGCYRHSRKRRYGH